MADKDFVVKNGLVVNTNALVVDGSTNKVGVNTASPDATFSVVGTANVSGNVTFSSNLSVTGNTYINGRFEVNNNAYIEKKLYVGNTDSMIQDLPTIIQAVDNFNGFVMISSQNLSKLDDACADLITYADNTNGLSHFNDVGINNSRFDGTIHRISANTLSDSFVLGETIFQRNNAGANIAVGILRDRTVINSTSRSLKISIQESDGLKTTLGAPQYTNTAGANLSLRGVTSGVNSSVLVAVGFFESDGANGTYSRRNFPFTIGRRGDGYLYNANSALTIGTTAGGMRTDEQTISVSFSSGANQITLSSGNTDLMYADMIVTGTGIPVDAYITSIANSITFNLSKPTTAGSSGTYTAKDPYYDASGNPIIFHVGGMTANDEIARFVGNGNFVIGPNTTSRADKFTVAGTANITGNVAFGNNITVAGNTTVTGTVNAASVLVGANVTVNATALRVGVTAANIIANSTMIQLSNTTATANLTVANLVFGTTLVNTSVVQVGTAAVLNTSAIKIGAVSNAVTVNTTAILIGNSLTSSVVNSTVFTGTAYNSGNLNSQPASYYTNATNINAGTIGAAYLPTGDTTTIGALKINDSVTNTSTTDAAALSSVKNAYDRAIDANTRAASAQTAAVSAYSNATTYTDGRIIDSVTNTFTNYAASANSVKNAYDRAIAANTRAASAQTAAIAAYTNAIAYSGNAALAYANATSYTDTTVANYALKSGTTFTGAVTVSSATFAAGNTTINGTLSATSNVNIDSGTFFVDSTSNRVGVNTLTPDATLQVNGNANVSGNLSIGGNFNVTGTLTTSGVTESAGNFVPAANNAYSLGNSSLRWDLYGNSAYMTGNVSAVNFIGTTVNATANISIGSNVVLTNTQVVVGTASFYSSLSNSAIETTGTVNAASFKVGSYGNTTTGGSTVNSTVIAVGNSSVNAIINSTAFTGTAANATLFNNQSASYYLNTTNILDSVVSTSVSSVAAANSVKNAYDRAIDANTRASSAQTAAVAAYSNGVTYTLSRIIDSVTNTFTNYAASANSVKNAYDRAIDANTRAASAQTAAASAYTNAIAYSGNAALAFTNAVAYVDSLKLDSVTNTSVIYVATANSVKNAYDRAIDANTRAASAQTAAVSAFSNAVSNAASDASTKAATAYSNAVANAASDASTKAATAFSNAVANAMANVSANYAAKAGATFTGAVNISNNLVVTGNLTVTGTTFSANVTNLDVTDKNITVAKGVATSALADGAGITVDVANATWNYNHATLSWQSNVAMTPATNNNLGFGTAGLVWSNGHVSNVYSTNIIVGANVVANATTLKVGNTTFTTTNTIFGGTVTVNGSIGSAGQVLTSAAGANAYWTTPTTGTVTSVAAANGIGGGTITGTGTHYVVANSGLVSNTSGVFVLANTGIVANTTGVFVNAAYIATISANLASPSVLGSTTANGASLTYANVSGQVNTATFFATTSANVGANVQMTTTTIKVGNTTLSTTNAIFGGTIAANGGIGSAGQVLTSAAGGNAYWATATGGAYYKGNQGSVGSTADKGNIYKINSNTQTSSVTIDAGENALTAGPMVISSGQNLTISDGGRVVIV